MVSIYILRSIEGVSLFTNLESWNLRRGRPPISANLFYSGKFRLLAFAVDEEYHSRILQLKPSAQRQLLTIEKVLSYVKVDGT